MPKAMSAKGARSMDYDSIYVDSQAEVREFRGFYVFLFRSGFGDSVCVLSTSQDPLDNTCVRSRLSYRSPRDHEIEYGLSNDGAVIVESLTLEHFRGQGFSILLRLFLLSLYPVIYSDRVISAAEKRVWTALGSRCTVVMGRSGDPNSRHQAHF